VIAAGATERFADDALILVARLRIQRGAKKRAALALRTVLCDHPKGDMVRRAGRLWKRHKFGAKKACDAGPASAPKVPKAAKPAVAPVVAAPVKPLALGPVRATGEKLHASVRRVRRIVLDPGHGGDDPGAVGPGGIKEADLAYDLTVAMADELRRRGYQVLLTRGRKDGRKLRDRTAYANRHQADLFVSIHLNSARRKAYGFEVYYLDVGADRYARRLAARENQQSEKEVGALAYILADLATKGNAADSRALAQSLTESVQGFRSNRKKEVRSALFAVLLGARMPAILIEAGFVTDGDDVKRMKSAKRRKATARFLADGVDAFAKKLKQERP
jgi:N-acetylmuramoyl-L-alanine amidase